MQVQKRRPAVLALLGLTLLLAGCGGSSGSSSAPNASKSPLGAGSAVATSAIRPTVIDVTINGDTVTPQARAYTVDRGSTVTLRVSSDRDAALHVHSTPAHEYDVKPGKSTFSFVLDKPGTVDIEEHVSDDLVAKVLVQ